MDAHDRIPPARPTRRPAPRRRGGGTRRVALALGLVVAAGALAGATSAPAPVQAMGRLPSCAVGDVYTVPRGYDDWSVTLVDRLLRVEDDYVPPDLVKLSDVGLPGGGHIREVAVDDTRAMAKAARAAGAPIGIWSAYRSYRAQTQIFNGYVSQYSFENAITYSARPGHSEHQLGLGVDFMSAGGGNPLPGDWGTTRAGRWMRENSWKYGWVLSYPRGADGARWNDRSCFRYEPWHYRYLGKEVAAEVHRSGLTIREYLWTHHTVLDRNGKPVVTASATPTSASPSASLTASPSATASGTASGAAPAGQSPGPTEVAQSPVGAGLEVESWTAALVGAGILALVAATALALRRHWSGRGAG